MGTPGHRRPGGGPVRRSRHPLHRLASGILLALAGACAGSAVADELSVVVRDETGAALADAVVTLIPLADQVVTPTANDPVVAQRGHRFVPFVLPVHRETAVEFPNYDETRHHVYSFSPAKTFEIKLYRGDPETRIVFDRPGIVSIGCNIHDYMQGFIYVTDAPLFAVTAQDGRALLADLPPGPYTLTVWHPWQTTDARPRRLELDGDAEVIRSLSLAPPPPARPAENALRQWVQGVDQ